MRMDSAQLADLIHKTNCRVAKNSGGTRANHTTTHTDGRGDKINPIVGQIWRHEHFEQVAFVDWLDFRDIRYAATPNGGKRSKTEAARLKREGVSAGFPDITIYPRPEDLPRPLLFIEMKRAKGGIISAAQRKWLTYLNALGDAGYMIRGRVCNGFAEAKQFCLEFGY